MRKWEDDRLKNVKWENIHELRKGSSSRESKPIPPFGIQYSCYPQPRKDRKHPDSRTVLSDEIAQVTGTLSINKDGRVPNRGTRVAMSHLLLDDGCFLHLKRAVGGVKSLKAQFGNSLVYIKGSTFGKFPVFPKGSPALILVAIEVGDDYAVFEFPNEKIKKHPKSFFK